MSGTKLSKAQKPTLNNKYQAFIAKGKIPGNNLSNPLNLFDEFNEKDKVWLAITRKYFNRAR